VRRRLLTEILGVRGRIDVLRGLVGLPQSYSGSARNISRMAGIDHRVGQRALDDLASTGLVRVRATPAANFFSVNAGHPLYASLKAVFEAEAGYTKEIQDAIVRGFEEHHLPVRNAYLYGSLARGDDDPRSDIDIVVVSDSGNEERVRAAFDDLAEELSARFGTRFHFMVATRPLEEMVRSEEYEGGLWARIAAESVEMV